MPELPKGMKCRVAVIWIDWYPYHVARFRGLDAAPSLHGSVVGLELVGGTGVHKGLKFREDLPAGLPVETLMPGASWLQADKLALSRALWRRLSELDPEIVLLPGYYTLPSIAAAVWARVHGRVSVLMTESTAGDHRRSWWKELPKRLALRLLFRWAVTGGRAHVAYLRQLGFPADRIVGCYDVVDNTMFREGALALRAGSSGTPARSPYFLYVGRLSEEKNVAGLLAAWCAYREQGGDWPLVLCGDGPERGALETLAARSAHAAEVHFAGLRKSRELLPFYAHAGCFVLPSTREPWGLVVNEAMAAELPVLVSERCGCAPDLVHAGVNGFTFDPSAPDVLTRLMLSIDRMQPEDRERMGRRSGEIIGRFSPGGFGDAIATVAAATRTPSSVPPVAEVIS